MENIILSAIGLFFIYLFYKTIIKEPDLKVTEHHSQDDAFCLIAAAISKANNRHKLDLCLNAIRKFDIMYNKHGAGRADVGDLLKIYVMKQEKLGFAV